MTPEQLKSSILQYAIQGKLVEQRSEEGTGEELFAQIQEEKKRLIAEKKIKKEKPLPEITEDEKPFDIPESWIWVRLSQIWSILNGDRGKNYPAKSTLSKTGIPFISAINLNGKTVVEDENLLCLSQIQYGYDMPYLSEEIIYNLRNSLLHQSTPNIEKSTIHESRCRVDKFELVITGEDGTNGDLSEVAYDKDMNIVQRGLKVHISHLCYILSTAAEDYYKNNKEKFDFIKYSIEDDRQKTIL